MHKQKKKRMIAYIEGPITVKSPTYVIIDAQGIGYQINISLHTYEQIGKMDTARLLTIPIIREDSHQLYGFFKEDERELFRLLIGISGIGPNTARTMLSSLAPEELKGAIIRGDVSLMKTMKGVGPKTAQRIIVELQDTLKKNSAEEFTTISEKTRIIDEALSAMMMLGFARPLAEKSISKIIRENPGTLTVEELIKQALKAI
jgi:Holliday junction DNA helicase RuvA